MFSCLFLHLGAWKVSVWVLELCSKEALARIRLDSVRRSEAHPLERENLRGRLGFWVGIRDVRLEERK